MNSSALSLGLSSSPDESATASLPIVGTIPSWLAGTLLRTGPALFEVGPQKYAHWFDGLAKLHRFAFKDGSVEYACRFLKSDAYQQAKLNGRISKQEFGTNPKETILDRIRNIFAPNLTDNANVNVTRLAGNCFVALTETPTPVQFDATTLDTIGHFRFSDQLRCQTSTAHPHVDKSRTYIYNICTGISAQSAYYFYRMATSGSTRELLGSLPVSRPGYIHSFALTDKYMILAESPLCVNPLDLLLSGKPFIENFNWHKSQPARFIIISTIERSKPMIIETDPFFVFHHVNAYERDDEIVVDLLAYEDSGVIKALYLDSLRNNEFTPLAELRRYILNARAGTLRCENYKTFFELPRINYSDCNAGKYRFVYGLTSGNVEFLQDIIKVDIESGRQGRWHDDDCFASEPVFVARSASGDSGREDEGVLLSIVLDSKKRNSFLLVLDAATLSELARAYLPHHVPFHFHGQFFGG